MATDPTTARRLRLLRLTVLTLSVALVVHLLLRHREDFRLLAGIRADRVALLIAASAVYLLLQAFRYRLVLEKLSGHAVAFRPWLALFVLARFLNTLVPQAGNLYRGTELKRHYGVSLTHYVTSLFSFAWLDTVVNLGLAAALLAGWQPTAGSRTLAAVLATLALLALLLPPLATRTLRSAAAADEPRPGAFGWLRGRIEQLLAVSVSALADRRYLAGVAFSGVVVFFWSSWVIYLTFATLTRPVSPADAALFYVFLRLGSLLNLTPGNLGIQELGFGLIGGSLAVGAGASILASGLLRAAATVALFALALPMGGLDLARQLRAPGAVAPGEPE